MDEALMTRLSLEIGIRKFGQYGKWSAAFTDTTERWPTKEVRS